MGVSDKLDTSYFIRIGADKHGTPAYKCTRGTSGLEAFHQKVRQLVHGSRNSPRYTLAIVHECIYRWNQEIDIQVLIEAEIDAMA